MSDDKPQEPLFERNTIRCPHCGNNFHTHWVGHEIKGFHPSRSGSANLAIGVLHSTTCTNADCGEPVLVMRRTMGYADENKPAPDATDAYMVLQEAIFINIIVEFVVQVLRAKEPKMSDAEEKTLREKMKEGAGKLWESAMNSLGGKGFEHVAEKLIAHGQEVLKSLPPLAGG